MFPEVREEGGPLHGLLRLEGRKPGVAATKQLGKVNIIGTKHNFQEPFDASEVRVRRPGVDVERGEGPVVPPPVLQVKRATKANYKILKT